MSKKCEILAILQHSWSILGTFWYCMVLRCAKSVHLTGHDVLHSVANHDVPRRLLQERDLFELDDVKIVDPTSEHVA